jgi:GxxExxY protein
MTINEVTYQIIGAAMKVHRTLGPGLLESAYEACLAYELEKLGLRVERQKPVPVVYDDVKLDCGFRADLLVHDLVIVECKAKEAIHPIDAAQVLSHLRLLNLSIGLLINFHTLNLKEGIRRIANDVTVHGAGTGSFFPRLRGTFRYIAEHRQSIHRKNVPVPLLAT